MQVTDPALLDRISRSARCCRIKLVGSILYPTRTVKIINDNVADVRVRLHVEMNFDGTPCVILGGKCIEAKTIKGVICSTVRQWMASYLFRFDLQLDLAILP